MMTKLFLNTQPQHSIGKRTAGATTHVVKAAATALLVCVPMTAFSAGIVFHDGLARFDNDMFTEDQSDHLYQQSIRQDRYARWMNIQDSRDVRSYAVNSNAGNGVDYRFDLRHSQVELYDADHWNPETLLHSSTQFQLVQRTGAGWLHAAGSFTDSESHYQTGLSVGPVMISASTGYGTGFSRLGGDQSDLDPWFFHGGSNVRFDFSGAAVGFSLNQQTSLNAGSWRVESDGLDTRKAQFVGVDRSQGSMNFGARVYSFSRGDEAMAQAVQLSAFGRLGGLGFRDFHHASGARIQELNLTYTGSKKATIGLSLSERTNPLFRASEDTRVMLSFSGKLGNRGSIFSVSDTDSTDAEPDRQSNRVRNSVLIGLGVVAGAVVASSGDDKQDEAARFPREEGAAFGVARSINPTCVRENREYGTWIYRNQDGTYSYLPLRQGDIDSVILGSPYDVPSGTRTTASYHCHGGPDPRYVNEEFSPQDIRVNQSVGVNGYLSTPAGSLQKYDIRTGNISRIGSVPNGS